MEFKFSVIMSVYNVEKYIREAVDSIISQTIAFEENVEIVFVDDGSVDSSGAICDEYAGLYPGNIQVIHKENGGLSDARNAGLDVARGRYINFFDPDDILSPNTLKRVFSFFEEYREAIDFVTIPLVYFEAKTGLHPKYRLMGKKDRIIKLQAEPYNFVFSSAASFYKAEVFEENRFDVNMFGAEDAKLNAILHRKNTMFGYVCQRGVKYYYRQRADKSSTVDAYFSDEKIMAAYRSSIDFLETLIEGKDPSNLPDYVKEIIIYETRGRVMRLNPKDEKLRDVLAAYRRFISMVDKDFIAYRTRWARQKAHFYALLSEFFAKESPFQLQRNGCLACDGRSVLDVRRLSLKIADVKFCDDGVEFDALFWDFGIQDYELWLESKSSRTRLDVSALGMPSPLDLEFGVHHVSRALSVHGKVPAKSGTYRFILHSVKYNTDYTIKEIQLFPTSPFVLNDRSIRVFRHGYSVSLANACFRVNAAPPPEWKYKLWSFLYIMKTYKPKGKKVNPNVQLASLWLRLFSKAKKKYLLFCDRPMQAGDNAEAFFRYYNKNHRKQAKNCYYILDKHSPDLKRIRKIGKVAKYGSLKHKFLYLNCKTLFSSHVHPLFTNAFDHKTERKFYADLLNFKLIWLQHGVLEKDVPKQANRYNQKVSAVVISSRHEKLIWGQSSYYYGEERLLQSGLPRFDLLKNAAQNIITVIPTWRNYLTGAVQSTGLHGTKDGFEDSDYFKNYSAFLTDTRLEAMLRQHGYKLRFVLHPGMAEYFDQFSALGTDVVEICETTKISFNHIIDTSKLMITDYSSVAFDFAYLGKPLLYFQFDKEQFFSLHYSPSEFFSYEKNGFGAVVKTVDELIAGLGHFFGVDFKNDEEYLARINNTFLFRDQNCCKRLYEAVSAMPED
ncbi:MAG: bifunctional glycosyltransferase family 2 protein/CDP-glycerol:glycerophosphate glycerophosphotransferase [Oscillospiraceae bacterium]|nr:bifunctional glycosyltransferase family 2 protein/CDP-glycerol:glycerophosphate glycerophosphotransferase [Oscillospiraceae bacterium]